MEIHSDPFFPRCTRGASSGRSELGNFLTLTEASMSTFKQHHCYQLLQWVSSQFNRLFSAPLRLRVIVFSG